MEAKTKDLWVFIETEEDGSPKKVGLELLNPGRRLADKQGGKLVAVVIGDNIAVAVLGACLQGLGLPHAPQFMPASGYQAAGKGGHGVDGFNHSAPHCPR